MSVRVVRSMPGPPYSSGMSMPQKPIVLTLAERRWKSSSGNSLASGSSLASSGRISSRTKRRTVATIIFCSSLSSRSIVLPCRDRAQAPELARRIASLGRQRAVIGDVQHQELFIAAHVLLVHLVAEAPGGSAKPRPRLLDGAAQAEERAPASIADIEDAALAVSELIDAELARQRTDGVRRQLLPRLGQADGHDRRACCLPPTPPSPSRGEGEVGAVAENSPPPLRGRVRVGGSRART